MSRTLAHLATPVFSQLFQIALVGGCAIPDFGMARLGRAAPPLLDSDVVLRTASANSDGDIARFVSIRLGGQRPVFNDLRTMKDVIRPFDIGRVQVAHVYEPFDHTRTRYTLTAGRQLVHRMISVSRR